jgi:hypothetical protein
MTFEPFTVYLKRCSRDLGLLADNPVAVAQWCYDHPPSVVHYRTPEEIDLLIATVRFNMRRNEPTLQPQEEA